LGQDSWFALPSGFTEEIRLSFYPGVQFTAFDAYGIKRSKITLVRAYSEFEKFRIGSVNGCVSSGRTVLLPYGHEPALINVGAVVSDPKVSVLVLDSMELGLSCNSEYEKGNFFIIKGNFDLKSAVTVSSFLAQHRSVVCGSQKSEISRKMGIPQTVRLTNSLTGEYDASIAVSSNQGKRLSVQLSISNNDAFVSGCYEILD